MPTQKKDNTGAIIEIDALGISTLAARTLIGTTGPVMLNGGSMISSTLNISAEGGTDGDPNLLVGIANADLTDAEVEEYLENQGPTNPDDTIGVERASRGRKIRVFGVLSPTASNPRSALSLPNHKMSGLRWTEESAGWRWWAFNLSSAAPMTTGCIVAFAAQHFVRWSQ